MHRLVVHLQRLVVAGALVALWGCGGGTPPSASPVASPASTLMPTAAPTTPATAAPTAAPTPAPTASGPQALCAVGHDGCVIRAGTYTTAPFEHAFTFVIPAAWNNTRAYEHGGGISTQEGGLNWASSIATGFDGTKQDAAVEPAIEPTAAAFIAFLMAVKSSDVLTRGESGQMTVGGISGRYVEFLRDEHGPAVGFSIAEDLYVIDPGAKARFIALDVDGALVVLVIEARFERTFDALMAKVQPVLDSIAWL